MTRARAALSGWQKRSTSNLPALSTAASAITLMMPPASDGNTVDLKCQHCGLPSEKINHLLSAPCGRWVHRRCRADHYPICDECQAAAGFAIMGQLDSGRCLEIQLDAYPSLSEAIQLCGRDVFKIPNSSGFKLVIDNAEYDGKTKTGCIDDKIDSEVRNLC